MAKSKISISIDEDVLRRVESQMKREGTRSLSEAMQNYVTLGLMRAGIKTAVLLMRKRDFHLLFEKVSGKFLIEQHLDFFDKSGIEQVYFITSHNERLKDLNTIIERHNMGVHFVYEEKEQGNISALRLVEKKIFEPFLLVYGDTYFMFDSARMIERHFLSKALVTVGLYGEKPQKTCSVITLDGDDIKEFKKGVQKDSLIIDIGVYILNPEIYRQFRPDDKSLEAHVFPRLCALGMIKGYFIYGEHKHLGPEVWD
jgi:NDP-sugar pyrophosphorylase family protein